MDTHNSTTTISGQVQDNGSGVVHRRKRGRPPKAVEKLEASVDLQCKDLLQRTAKRNHIQEAVLIELAIESFVGSLEHYGFKTTSGDLPPTIRTKGQVQVPIGPRQWLLLKRIGGALGVSLDAMVRDAILAQRFNFQRMQSVNSRSMGSVRMPLFELEQQGGIKRD